MNINYDYYRIFYFVAKYGNISQAAKLLLNNQPNLTRTIKNLESELGCPLFSRTNRGMRLTPEGQKLYEHIKVAIEHIEAGEEEITESKNLQTGTVFVAASEVALRCLLLPVLKKFRMLYPGVRIRISNHSTPQAIAALKEFFATKERLEREHEAQQSPALEDNADNGAFGSAFEKRRAKQKADKVIFSAWDELRDKFHFNPGHTELKIDDYVYLVAETIKTDSDKERYHDLLEIVMPEVYEAMFGLPPYRDTPHGLNGSGKSGIRP